MWSGRISALNRPQRGSVTLPTLSNYLCWKKSECLKKEKPHLGGTNRVRLHYPPVCPSAFLHSVSLWTVKPRRSAGTAHSGFQTNISIPRADVQMENCMKGNAEPPGQTKSKHWSFCLTQKDLFSAEKLNSAAQKCKHTKKKSAVNRRSRHIAADAQRRRSSRSEGSTEQRRTVKHKCLLFRTILPCCHGNHLSVYQQTHDKDGRIIFKLSCEDEQDRCEENPEFWFWKTNLKIVLMKQKPRKQVWVSGFFFIWRMD